jgi:hypothetical protein
MVPVSLSHSLLIRPAGGTRRHHQARLWQGQKTRARVAPAEGEAPKRREVASRPSSSGPGRGSQLQSPEETQAARAGGTGEGKQVDNSDGTPGFEACRGQQLASRELTLARNNSQTSSTSPQMPKYVWKLTSAHDLLKQPDSIQADLAPTAPGSSECLRSSP